MPIKLESSGFYEWHDSMNGVPMLGISTARLDDCLTRYQDGNFYGLFGHESFGFEQDNLDFLSRTPDATHLWLWDVSLQNIDGIYKLTEPEYVGVNPKRPGIDFSCFETLRTAINHWIRSDKGIADSTISEYPLWHFNPRSKSFDGLEIPLQVQHLEINRANPSTLDGLPVLTKLKELQIHRCRNLADLSALPRIAPNLRKLLTTTSSRIDTSAGILDHPALETALIDGKHIILNGG